MRHHPWSPIQTFRMLDLLIFSLSSIYSSSKWTSMGSSEWEAVVEEASSDLRPEWILSTAPSLWHRAAQNTYFHWISTVFPGGILVFHQIFGVFSPVIRQTEIFWRAAVGSPNREIYCAGLIIVGRKIGTRDRWNGQTFTQAYLAEDQYIICLSSICEIF